MLLFDHVWLNFYIEKRVKTLPVCVEPVRVTVKDGILCWSPTYEFNVRTYTISSVRLKPRIGYKIAVFLIREILVCTFSYERKRHPTTACTIDVRIQHQMCDIVRFLYGLSRRTYS